MLDSVMKTNRTVHISDLAATQAYLERHPIMVEAVELGGVRTIVGVPIINENELVGLIGIRQEVRPFTDKQVALLTSFASQAVIAIENTRLLTSRRSCGICSAISMTCATSYRAHRRDLVLILYRYLPNVTGRDRFSD
jgi:transcriptional regulator with GAF, ATPase, and Fis domain